MAIFRRPRADQTPAALLRERERKAQTAAQQSTEAQHVAAVTYAQGRTAAEVTAFINSGPNVWLDARLAWMAETIAADTARGGSCFER
jgi:hypothetical protein